MIRIDHSGVTVAQTNTVSNASSGTTQANNTAFLNAMEMAMASGSNSDPLLSPGLSSGLGTGLPTDVASGTSPSTAEWLSALLSTQGSMSVGDQTGSDSSGLSLDSIASLTGGSGNPNFAAALTAYLGGSLGTLDMTGITDSSASGAYAMPSTATFPVLPGSGTSALPATVQTDGSPAQSTIEALIAQMAPQYGLSPSLVSAVVSQESGFSAQATSPAGAMGLMQLMPSTAASLGVSNPYDPISNLRGGMQYLSGLMKQYHGDVSLALAAYNAGPGAVEAYGGIPPFPETQGYVQSILAKVQGA